jgi:hypothetical protein
VVTSAVTPDELIAAIARGERKAQPGDGRLVRTHISQAPFNRERRLEKQWARIGDTVVGCAHPTGGAPITNDTALSSLERHVAKRIRDGQWKASTTISQYEADCQRAAGIASIVKAGVRMVPLAATQTHVTAADFPQLTIVPGQVVLVVYDTDKKRITTSYYLPEAQAPVQVYKHWVQQPRPVLLPLSTP